MRRGPLAALVAAAIAIAIAQAADSASAATGLPGREADPIVLKGADVPALLGVQPDAVVAFAYDDGWQQIPVQVDERAVVNYSTVRQIGGSFTHEAYTDSGTFAGPDPDPTLDDGDEIAMMAKDAGGDAGDVPSPDGVVASTRTSVRVRDPLDAGPQRFIYLFQTNSGLDPAAGQSYVNYDFSLDSGDYKTTYDWNGVANDGAGPPANTEDSTVTTAFYRQHLLSRWIEDELGIKAGSSTNVDILDGDKVQVAYGCGRSELTFSRGGGGFIVNRSGPVRAIRSYIGANSGTYTQQDRTYYQRSEVTTVDLRVHPGINVISQFLDFSPAAAGMTYRNSAKPSGVTIDGVPDPTMETENSAGPEVQWEQATGQQGTLSVVSRYQTDIDGIALGSYYQDDSTSPLTQQCGGYADDQAWGSSGSVITMPAVSGGVNTDPTLGPANSFSGTRTTFYSAPGGDQSLAELRSEQIDNPLTVTTSAPPEPAKPRLQLTAASPKRKVAPGGSVRVRVTVKNTGGSKATNVEVCGKAPKRLARTGCRRTGSLGAGKRFRTKLRVSTTGRANPPLRIRFKATADDAKPARATAKIRLEH